jgi:ribosomal protein S21
MIVILSDKSRWNEAELLKHSREYYYYDYPQHVWVRRHSNTRKRHKRHGSSLQFELVRPHNRRSLFF